MTDREPLDGAYDIRAYRSDTVVFISLTREPHEEMFPATDIEGIKFDLVRAADDRGVDLLDVLPIEGSFDGDAPVVGEAHYHDGEPEAIDFDFDGVTDDG